MRPGPGGGPAALLLLCRVLTLAAAAAGMTGMTGMIGMTGAARAQDLVASRADGTEIARLPAPEGTGWCILWTHSVAGFPVADCYETRGGRMVLVSSRQPDFAAGLGHIPGRGRQVSDGAGGYWILDIDEAVPGDAYVLRPGAGAVDHRIAMGDRIVSLSAVAPRERVRIALTGGTD